MKSSITWILVPLTVTQWIAITPPVHAEDQTLYSLRSQHEFSVGTRHREQATVQSTITDTLITDGSTEICPTQTAEAKILYEVEILETEPDLGPVLAVYEVRTAKASMNDVSTWAPKPGTRIEVSRSDHGQLVTNMPKSLDPEIDDLLRLTFSTVARSEPVEHSSFLPEHARIGDSWDIDIEAFREMTSGNFLSYDEAELSGKAKLVARGTLRDVDVLIIEMDISAEGISQGPGPGPQPELPLITGTASINAQVIVPVDMAEGPLRSQFDSRFELIFDAGHDRIAHREATGRLQIDYFYED